MIILFNNFLFKRSRMLSIWEKPQQSTLLPLPIEPPENSVEIISSPNTFSLEKLILEREIEQPNKHLSEHILSKEVESAKKIQRAWRNCHSKLSCTLDMLED